VPEKVKREEGHALLPVSIVQGPHTGCPLELLCIRRVISPLHQYALPWLRAFQPEDGLSVREGKRKPKRQETAVREDKALQGSTKLRRLQEILTDMEGVAVAFSGGVDSTFLLKVAHDNLRDRVIAITGRSESVPPGEMENAQRLACLIGVRHVLIETREIEIREYRANPSNRCYFCKRELYEKLRVVAEREGIAAVVDGTNADDLRDHRPGVAASRELQVRSPLAEVGLTKAEIRTLSQVMGLPTYDKPSAPCLASRIPYGEVVTIEKLNMIGQAEQVLHALGFRECRVRHHGEGLARIEIPLAELPRLLEPGIRDGVVASLKGLGYRFIAMDLEGFRSGRLNEALLPMVSKPDPS
jgi:uncharacterized protein